MAEDATNGSHEQPTELPDPTPDPGPAPAPRPGSSREPKLAEDASLQDKVNSWLNDQSTIPGRVSELVVGVLIILACSLYLVESSPIHPDLLEALQWVELVITIIFVIEYLVRWWAKDFSVRYLLTPMAVIDLIAILPVFIPAKHFQFVRVLRMFRILRLLRLVQRQEFFFGQVTTAHLMVLRILLTVFCLVFVTGGIVYEFEHETNPAIGSIFDAIYFAIVTLTTVGFGDISPITWPGRVVTVIAILAGVLILPWQLTNLISTIVRETNKIDTICKACGLRYHDPDASHCKSCGTLIYQEYTDGT